MDTDQLHSDIHAAYTLDPVVSAHLPEPSEPQWKISNGLLLLNDRIYVPDIADLDLHVLKTKHDHPLSGHLGQNKTLELVHHDYIWPAMHTFVKDYCSSCTI